MSTKHRLSNKFMETSLEADSIISNHLSSLNRVSNDIKALENTLRAAAIPFTFIYTIFSETQKCERTPGPYEDWPSVEVTINNDYGLVWGKTEDGIYRLSYNQYVTADEVSYHHYEDKMVKKSFKGEPYLTFSRPLIETKANIRLKIEKELPIFYGKIIEALKTRSNADRIIVDSPNYGGLCSSICFAWSK